MKELFNRLIALSKSGEKMQETNQLKTKNRMLLLGGLTRSKRTKSLSSDVVIRDAILMVHQTLHLKTL